MRSNNNGRFFIGLLFSIGCALSLASHDGDMESGKTKKKRGSQGKRQESCVAGPIDVRLKNLFPSEEDRKQVQAIAHEITRYSAIEVGIRAPRLVAIAKQAKVSLEGLIATLTLPESGMDEMQTHLLIQVAVGAKSADAWKVSEEAAKAIDALVESKDASGAHQVVKQMLTVSGYGSSLAHVLVHKSDKYQAAKPETQQLVETALREVRDEEAKASIVKELKTNKDLVALMVDKDGAFEKFAGLLRKYQNLDTSTEQGEDQAHEMAEDLAHFAEDHGFLGALPAVVGKHQADYCLLGGSKIAKRDQLEEEVAEYTEHIADRLGLRHLRDDKDVPPVSEEAMATWLRDLGGKEPGSAEFKSAANKIINQLTRGSKTGDPKAMSLVEVLHFADQAGMLINDARRKAFVKLAQAQNLAATPGVDFRGLHDDAKKEQIRREMAAIKKESDPQHAQKMTAALLAKAEKFGVDQASIVARLTSDSELLQTPDPARNALPKRHALQQAFALSQVPMDEKKALVAKMGKLGASLEYLGSVGPTEEKAKTGNWKALADRLLADNASKAALMNLSEGGFWMGERAKYMHDSLNKNKVAAEKTKPRVPVAMMDNKEVEEANKTGSLLISAIGAAIPYASRFMTGRPVPKETELSATEKAHANAAMGTCIACHKNHDDAPKATDRESFIKELKSHGDEKPEDILTEMLAKAEGEHHQTREQSHAFAKFVGLKIDETELDKAVEKERQEHAPKPKPVPAPMEDRIAKIPVPQMPDMTVDKETQNHAFGAMGTCIACHKEENGPKIDLSKAAFNTELNNHGKETPQHILTEMLAKAEGEKGQARKQSLALAKYLEIEINEKELDEMVEKERKAHAKTPEAKGPIAETKPAIVSPYPRIEAGGTYPYAYAAYGTTPGVQQTGGALAVLPGGAPFVGGGYLPITGAQNNQTFGPINNGQLMQQQQQLAGGLGQIRFTTVAPGDVSVGVPNFALSEEGKPLSVNGQPLFRTGVDGKFPGFALVANNNTVNGTPGRFYFITDRNGNPNRTALKVGESVRGDFIGQDPKMWFALVEDGKGGHRFAPAPAAAQNSVTGFAAHERDEQVEAKRLAALDIPRMPTPASLILREQALLAAGYTKPADFDELKNAGRFVHSGYGANGPRSIVVDEIRRVAMPAGNEILDRQGFVFVNGVQAKLTILPSTQSLALNGDQELMRNALHVDVFNSTSGMHERVWAARDATGVYLVRMPISVTATMADGKTRLPIAGAEARVEPVLQMPAQYAQQGLSTLAETPKKPFIDATIAQDFNDARTKTTRFYQQLLGKPVPTVANNQVAAR